MKKHIICALLISFLSATSFAQINPKWEQSYDGEIAWQKITGLGNLIIQTSKGLKGINTETGVVEWNHSFLSDINKEDFKELSGNSFVKVKKMMFYMC